MSWRTPRRSRVLSSAEGKKEKKAGSFLIKKPPLKIHSIYIFLCKLENETFIKFSFSLSFRNKYEAI